MGPIGHRTILLLAQGMKGKDLIEQKKQDDKTGKVGKALVDDAVVSKFDNEKFLTHFSDAVVFLRTVVRKWPFIKMKSRSKGLLLDIFWSDYFLQLLFRAEAK